MNVPRFDFSSPASSTSATAGKEQASANLATTTIFDKNSLPTFSSLAAQAAGNKGTIFGNKDSSVSASPIFTPMNFGSGTQPPATIKPLFATSTTTPMTSKHEAGGDEEGGEDNQGNPEDYEPQVIS